MSRPNEYNKEGMLMPQLARMAHLKDRYGSQNLSQEATILVLKTGLTTHSLGGGLAGVLFRTCD